MGLGWRVFAFEDDGTMRRIPQRVVNDDEALPEYADKIGGHAMPDFPRSLIAFQRRSNRLCVA